MSTNAVWAKLEARLSANAGGVAVAWPNQGYTPVHGTPYLRPTLLPARIEQASLGSTGYNRERGIYQIDCFYPVATGRKAGMTKAEALAVVFKRGTVISGTGFSIRIVNAYVGAMRQEPNWAVFPVIVEYLADTPPS